MSWPAIGWCWDRCGDCRSSDYRRIDWRVVGNGLGRPLPAQHVSDDWGGRGLCVERNGVDDRERQGFDRDPGGQRAESPAGERRVGQQTRTLAVKEGQAPVMEARSTIATSTGRPLFSDSTPASQTAAAA